MLKSKRGKGFENIFVMGECILIFLADAIASFLSPQDGKIKRLMDKRVGVGEVCPCSTGDEVMSVCMVFGCVGWSDKARIHCAKYCQCPIAILQPKLLIDGVIANIGGMGHIKVDQETTILKAGREQGDRVLKSNTHQARHSQCLPPKKWEMKKCLSELEILGGAREVMEGGECLRTCGDKSGSVRWPVYNMTDGQNGVLSSKYWRRSSSLNQGNSSMSLLSYESVGQ